MSIKVLNPEVEARIHGYGSAFTFGHLAPRMAGRGYLHGAALAPGGDGQPVQGRRVVARFESHMGCHPIRGSSTKGGMAAKKAMIRYVKQGGKVATNVADGPNGPRYKAKAGMISLAQLTGAPLIPVIWSSDRAWCFRRSWDKTMIPKPFAKCMVLYGKPMEVPRRLSREQAEQYRQMLENELNRIKDEVDRLCKYQDP